MREVSRKKGFVCIVDFTVLIGRGMPIKKWFVIYFTNLLFNSLPLFNHSTKTFKQALFSREVNYPPFWIYSELVKIAILIFWAQETAHFEYVLSENFLRGVRHFLHEEKTLNSLYRFAATTFRTVPMLAEASRTINIGRIEFKFKINRFRFYLFDSQKPQM